MFYHFLASKQNVQGCYLGRGAQVGHDLRNYDGCRNASFGSLKTAKSRTHIFVLTPKPRARSCGTIAGMGVHKSGFGGS